MNRKYFGTDGIRGRVGEGCITAEFVLKLGWAFGQTVREGHAGRPKVVIGKDTRLSGYMFETALEAGLIAAGVDTVMLGPMPTPAIAYLTRALSANGGIVISASHNGYEDNGIKFFNEDGTKLPDDVEREIERLIDIPLTTVDGPLLGRASRAEDAASRYIEFCKNTLRLGTDLSGLKIIVDCAHGASYQIAPKLFRDLGAEVEAIGVTPDGLNINNGVGSTAPDALIAAVKSSQADVGIAFDGDADRIIMVDETGALVDGDEILFIIVKSRHQRGVMSGGVVGTLMTNLGLEKALANMRIPFVRTSVGDRYVSEVMEERQWILGGEASGHIICSDLTSTGDGLIAALQVLNALLLSGQTLSQARHGMTKYPQILINVPLVSRDNLDHQSIKDTVTSIESRLGDSGRVVLRPSGTEPVVRVMVEGAEEGEVRVCAEQIAMSVEKVASIS
ncbi:MAG: phosphoglucosamine mutase [Litorivicinaceae bacterium]